MFATQVKKMGLGARWHREALFVFASARDRVVSHARALAKLCLDFSSSMSKP
jgi:hypothetical protein